MPLRVLIVGAGDMANTHAEAMARIEGVSLVAAVDPNTPTLNAFCARHSIAEGFANVEDALSWGQFDAAANVTPDGVHRRTTLPLLAAGKHVLCEKPLATSYAEAREMAEAAEAAGVVNMVNLTYRRVPALQVAHDLVAKGAIGAVRHFEASYFQSWLAQSKWGDWRTADRWLWRLSTAHGSNGVLGDIGVHIIDYAAYAAGAMPVEIKATLATYPKAPGDRIGDYVLDANDSFVMNATLANGALGTISATRFASGHVNDLRLRLYGTEGGLEVLFESGQSRLRGCLGDARSTPVWSDIKTPATPTTYERFIGAIRGDMVPAPDFARGAALQQVLDLAAVGGGLIDPDQSGGHRT